MTTVLVLVLFITESATVGRSGMMKISHLMRMKGLLMFVVKSRMDRHLESAEKFRESHRAPPKRMSKSFTVTKLGLSL
jgi:hypothetical protein